MLLGERGGGAASSRVSRANRRLLTFSRTSRLAHAGALIGVIQRLSLARSLPDVQRIVRTAARELSGADGATFVLRDEDRCFYIDEDAIAPLWKGQRFPLHSCISGWTMLNRRPAVIPDIYQDARISRDLYEPTFVKSLTMVPIRRLDPLGAIGAYWARYHHPSDEQLELLQALADSTAVAMENVRFYRELEDSRMDTLRRLALAVEIRDDDTYQHTERVARTSFLLANRLGLSHHDATLIRQAAPLHDIGKLAVHDAVLLKPGTLTRGEFEEVKRHATAGAAILTHETSALLQVAQEIALTHHEWWDGSGYPSQLKGSEIPVSGRVVALADVFDALTHPRPYKQAWPVGDALGEVRRLAGLQFDPSVVEAFLELDHKDLVEAPGATRDAAPDEVRRIAEGIR
jgi:putative two-component system response regulator